MSTKKQALLLGIGLSTVLASSAVIAGTCANNEYCWAPQVPKGYGPAQGYKATVPPTFNATQKNAICLMEANLAILAAYAHKAGCGSATTFAFGVKSSSSLPYGATSPVPFGSTTAYGTSSLTTTGTPITLKSGVGDASDATYGDRCYIDSTAAAGVVGTIGGQTVTFVNPPLPAPLPYPALPSLRSFSWTGNGNIMAGGLRDFQIGIVGATQSEYGENIIKDFGRKDDYQFGGAAVGRTVDIDWGLEAIFKNPGANVTPIPAPPTGEIGDSVGFPVSKWWQRSVHWPSNGIDGVTKMEKTELVNAGGAGSCQLVLSLTGTDEGGDFDESGTITLGPRK